MPFLWGNDCGALSHLLLEIVEQLRIEEFAYGNIQTVAQFLDSCDPGIISRSIDDVADGGLRDPRNIR